MTWDISRDIMSSGKTEPWLIVVVRKPEECCAAAGIFLPTVCSVQLFTANNKQCSGSNKCLFNHN